ncbi:MAG TPA: fibronectin type III domain-containing protein [Candidatus Peregrinibacteria bacterium]|nr:fibronectin type III domain-containing protein [Candidatus Peregrinibacteria bacterium]
MKTKRIIVGIFLSFLLLALGTLSVKAAKAASFSFEGDTKVNIGEEAEIVVSVDAEGATTVKAYLDLDFPNIDDLSVTLEKSDDFSFFVEYEYSNGVVKVVAGEPFPGVSGEVELFTMKIASKSSGELSIKHDLENTVILSEGVDQVDPESLEDPAATIEFSGTSTGIPIPQDVRVFASSNYFKLNWDNESLNSDIDGYNIYCGEESGEYTITEKVGNVDEYRVTENVKELTTYYCALATRAVEGDLESPLSGEITFDTKRTGTPIDTGTTIPTPGDSTLPGEVTPPTPPIITPPPVSAPVSVTPPATAPPHGAAPPQYAATGPEHWALFFGALALAGYLTIRKKYLA